MIIFLTLIYVALLFVLVKMNVIKLTLAWKLSPLLWILIQLLFLFFPMQWGAPSGPVNVYQQVVEIVPNVSGEVVDVLVKGLAPLKANDALFQIDPAPFQDQVDLMQSKLADASQSVERLKANAEAAAATVRKTEADIELGKADQVSAIATVAAANAALKEAKGKKQLAEANLVGLTTEVAVAQREYDRLQSLDEAQATSKTDLDRAELQLSQLKTAYNTAEIDVRVSDDTIARSAAEVDVAQAAAASVDLKVKQLTDAELPRVKALATEAELAATAMLGDDHTLVASAKSELRKAKFELTETTVRAPSDGFVVGMSLRPGQRVGNMPLRSWMSFVPREDTTLVAGIAQYALRNVAPGQQAEVVLKLYPGRVFSATVDEIVYITPQGQLQASGTIAVAPTENQTAIPFGVRLKLEDAGEIDATRFPGGAVGTAAIFTKKSKATHFIRRVMLRMETWSNYIIP